MEKSPTKDIYGSLPVGMVLRAVQIRDSERGGMEAMVSKNHH